MIPVYTRRLHASVLQYGQINFLVMKSLLTEGEVNVLKPSTFISSNYDDDDDDDDVCVCVCVCARARACWFCNCPLGCRIRALVGKISSSLSPPSRFFSAPASQYFYKNYTGSLHVIIQDFLPTEVTK
jgi:hypothetical protein